jgi:hypothetical protein
MARRGYANFPFCVAGILINFVREYTGTGWQPEVVALNNAYPDVEHTSLSPVA